ncbi:MAG: zinc ABC transporter substrate-binding protein, partial [Acetobacterales bacterium]
FAAAAVSPLSQAKAEIRVFACEPEWAALAGEIGGENVTATSATTASQDPHHIRARPSLIARIRRADLVFCTGAGLEIGWLPLLLQRGAPAGVQPGTPGHLMAADHVTLLEKPERVDRADGDIHPEGNPHVHLDPRNLTAISAVLSQRLAALDPQNSEAYRQRAAAFAARWQDHIAGWERRARSLKDMPVIVHHKSWTYLVRWLDLRVVATLEPKPGLPPTSAHLESLLALARTQRIAAILRTPYDPSAPSEWLSERTDIRALELPATVGGDGAKDLGALFEAILARLEEAARER